MANTKFANWFDSNKRDIKTFLIKSDKNIGEKKIISPRLDILNF